MQRWPWMEMKMAGWLEKETRVLMDGGVELVWRRSVRILKATEACG